MDIENTIRSRKSVRNYESEPIDGDLRKSIEDAISESWSPFGGSISIRLKSFPPKESFKPGTYGVIRGASDFLLMAMAPDDTASAITAGFRMEQVVLQATRLGLGTCWIEGTFKESDFGKGEDWPDGQELKIISPVGIPKMAETMVGKLARFLIGSDRRQPFEKMFFENDKSTPISTSNRFAESLAMMRLAPSSTNSQPWRAIAENDGTIHFFSAKKGLIHIIDCGIGLCHFILTEQSLGHDGAFKKLTDPECGPVDGWIYITSYRREIW